MKSFGQITKTVRGETDFWSLILFFAFFLLFVSRAYADCLSPSSPEGGLQYFSGDDYKYCDGTDWIDWGSGGSGVSAGDDRSLQFNNSSSFGGASNVLYTAGGLVQLTTMDASTKGLVVKGSSSQTANLLEWQNSGGTALSFVASSGALNTVSSVYSAGWNGSTEVPTKDAVYDKIQTLGGGGTPAGSNKEIQYNNSGSFGSTSTFVYDASTGRLGVGTATPSQVFQARAANPKLSLVNSSASDIEASLQLFGTNTLARLLISADTTNKATGLYVAPNGTGSVALGGDVGNSNTFLMLFETDFEADTTNWGSMQLSMGANGGFIDMRKGGTGTLRPFSIAMSDSAALTVATTGRVGIRSTSPGAQMQVDTANGAVKGLIVKGYSAQSVNLQEWQNSSGTALSFVASSGALNTVNSAYSAGWNGSTEVPTKDAVYDKIQTLDSSADIAALQNGSLEASFIGSLSDGTFVVVTYAAFAFDINGIYGLASTSGTATLDVKINGTTVTGLGSLSVSSTPQNATATAANSVSVGDQITFVISSSSSLVDLLSTLSITRI